MKAISDCFRIILTVAFEIETTLASSETWLWDKILRSITRMQSLSSQHSVTTWIQQAHRNEGDLPQQSNLENLIKHYPQYMQKNIKIIHDTIIHPISMMNIINANTHRQKQKRDRTTSSRVYSTRDIFINNDDIYR